jgi:hypothetical protein
MNIKFKRISPFIRARIIIIRLEMTYAWLTYNRENKQIRIMYTLQRSVFITS